MEIPRTHTSIKKLDRGLTVSGEVGVRCQDRFLVERAEPDSWTLVDSCDRTIADSELRQSFGLWKDAAIISGSQVIRSMNGLIEPDEVIPMKEVLDQPYDRPVASTSKEQDLGQLFDHLVPVETQVELTPKGGEMTTHWQNHYRFSVQQKNNYLI